MKNGIKSLAFAVHKAAEVLGGINPELFRPVIENATGCVWWLVSRQDDTLHVVDVGGTQRAFNATDVKLPDYRPAMPPVQLSTGKLVKSFRHPAGYQYTVTPMNDSEWREFCGLSKQWKSVHRDYDDRVLLSSSFNGPG